MEFKDYYKVLGIERTADQKAVSRAFRALARKFHPDVNKDPKATDRFKEINEAYQVLGDAERRAKYDQILDLRQHGGGWEDLLRSGGGPGGGGFRVYTSGDAGEFSEFFQQLFGGLAGGAFAGAFGAGTRGRGGRVGPFEMGDLGDLMGQAAGGRAGAEGRAAGAGGQDVEGQAEITLEEAFHGTRRTVTVPAVPGRAARTIEITIPRGVREGQRIRAAGQGHDGDLYLTVSIRPHPVFARDGDDLTCDAPVPVWTAALGGEVQVPTLGGHATMKVPAGTHDGQVFRLRGQGMPHVRGEGAGDQRVRVRLALPDPLTDRDRELLAEMRRLHETRAAAP